jgi:hypothetical protein
MQRHLPGQGAKPELWRVQPPEQRMKPDGALGYTGISAPTNMEIIALGKS